MTSFRRLSLAALTIAATWLISGCGGGGGGGSTATNDTATVTPSAANVTAVINGSTPVTITFTSSDSKPLSNLSVNLSALPAGWSSTSATFSCATVTSGNGCVLNLSFAPTVASSGTLALGYTYTNNAGTPQSGTTSVPYASTTHNNVVATATPGGPYAVVAGSNGSQAVSVYFTTDDGNPATNLQVTSGTTSLPAGWTTSAANLTCASVSSGNGCALPLVFTPTTQTSGTITIGYSYLDDSGTGKNGSIQLTYSSTTHNHVVGTAAPAGPIAGTLNAASNVTVTFTTDDGTPATNVVVTPADLTSLPQYWSVTNNLTPCASITTGNGCQVLLKYQPVTTGSGTITLHYSYTDNSGQTGTGTVQIPYGTTVNNSVQTSITPTGTINGVVGGAPVTATIAFTTTDGNPATNLQVTSGLPLTGQWTGPTTFACTQINGSAGSCALALTYTATATGPGSFMLGFSYTSNSGVAKTGTVQVSYAGVTHNTVIATPSLTSLTVPVGSTQNVTFTFNTNDTNPATNLNVPTPTLPSGWTSVTATPHICATISNTGIGCQLTLSYAPTADTSATALAVPFTYVDNAGTTQNANATLTYTAISSTVIATPSPANVAIAPGTSQVVTVPFNTTDHTATLQAVTPASTLPTGWTLTPPTTNCAVATTGAACSASLTFAPAVGAAQAGSITLSYTYLSNTSVSKTGSVTISYATPAFAYIADGGSTAATNKIVQCSLGGGATPTLTGCATAFTSANAGFDPRAIVFDNVNGVPKFAYISSREPLNGVPGVIYVCQVTAATGVLTGCAISLNSPAAPQGMSVSTNGIGDSLYVSATGGVLYNCPISSTDGSLGFCADLNSGSAAFPAGFVSPAAVVVSGSDAWIADEFQDGSPTTNQTVSGSVIHCTVSSSDGSFSNCTIVATGAGVNGGIAFGHNNPESLTLAGSKLIVGFPGGVSTCGLAATGGTFTGCTATAYANDAHGVASANGGVIVDDNLDGIVQSCTPLDATMTCTPITGTTVVTPEVVTIN